MKSYNIFAYVIDNAILLLLSVFGIISNLVSNLLLRFLKIAVKETN
jgi:hypothetical protein